LNNVENLNLDVETTNKLRLIAIIHDSFKYKVDISKPRIGINHHSIIAFEFAKKYIADEDILIVIKTHDDAYNIWLKAFKRNNVDKAMFLLRKLFEDLIKHNALELYTSFYYCDNNTGGKLDHCYQWFLDQKKKFIENDKIIYSK